ncbi:hypothetical protein HETIRDRAFT_163562 [Heterobasidion irregulare TC 32-1]|uniref:Uncharacterized protein n=1 Tax=Heterobasidion irregulare (strain TC 32-1) TaxID=747525 RepID=W4KBN9_HETIT|nr:uncharacterized protein HETIRDRAFT_163562 [Heterobasidion irregulare TC 32-1]ETW83149.1 hypothetical protein HETIRDRAFT_163562 [Heterobasidion irregulare TC 32-1]
MEKDEVWHLQTVSHTWKCDPILKIVTTVNCERALSLSLNFTGPIVCTPCMQIDFKNALCCKVPLPKNAKYLNTCYRDESTIMAYA